MRNKRKSSSSLKKFQNPKLSFWSKIIQNISYLKVPILLLLLLIIKLGQIPFKLSYCLAKIITWLDSGVSRHNVGIPRMTIIHLPHGIPRRRRRGRPRKTPLPAFYLHKIKKRLAGFIPKKIRFKVAVFTVILILSVYTLMVAKISTSLPSPSQLKSTHGPLTTQILDRSGNLLFQFYDGKDRTLIKLNDLPPDLIHATIAIEDRHFFTHPGIDIWGIARAVKTNIEDGKLQGGSTITQQLIKNTLLTPDQTIKRKIKEVMLAFWTERVYSKDEILQMYFNEVPYGGSAWGIEAASKMYFGKHARDLDLAESAFLAGLPAAPTEFSPFGVHPEKGKQRQKEVLQRMVEDGYITQNHADIAFTQNLVFRPSDISIKAPHFVMYIKSLLASKYGERTLLQGGLKVVTTLDLNIQELAENIVADQVNKLSALKVSNGAAMVTDSKSGQILAMVGSKNYFDPQGGNFNATLALRSPGSSIKVVTYGTAFKQGFTPANILLDSPVTFPSSFEKPYSPINYDGKFHGPVTIRTALGSSYNVPAVKMLNIVGIPNFLQTAKDMGITTFVNPQNYGLSLTLGGGAVRMIDMMEVYGVLASGGQALEPQGILTVTDASGNILEDHRQDWGKKVLSEEIVYLLSNILSDNNARAPAFGVNSQLKIESHNVAVKTGTSDDKRDNWVFGYTPQYVVGVWVGNFDNSPMDPQLSSGITGATPIWHDIMINLLKDNPDLIFKKPSGIVNVIVDGHKDLGIMGQQARSITGVQKIKQKGEKGEEKEVLTYTDPFSTYTPNLTPQPQAIQ